MKFCLTQIRIAGTVRLGSQAEVAGTSKALGGTQYQILLQKSQQRSESGEGMLKTKATTRQAPVTTTTGTTKPATAGATKQSTAVKNKEGKKAADLKGKTSGVFLWNFT
jgi:hypothetical protein